MVILLPTQEIGSLDKMGEWRRKGVTNRYLEPGDWDELDKQRRLFEIDGTELPFDLDDILRKPKRTKRDNQHVKDWSAFFALKMFERAGLNKRYTGEQHRSEMYQQPVTNIDGFEFVGWIRSWGDDLGNRYFKKARVVSEPTLKKPFHVDEYKFAKEHVNEKCLKVPITGAYTLADWSFNEYYTQRLQRKNLSRKQVKYQAKRDLTMALARNVLRPHLEALNKAGADYIQIDEPAAATKPNEIDILVDAYNESVKDLDAKFALHICFTNYDALFPEIQKIENCDMFTWEFANRDDSFESYDHILGLIKKYTPGKQVGLGVVNVHVDDIEPPELVRDRILYAVDILGDPQLIYVNPDCGLRTRPILVAYKKLVSMVEGTYLAREILQRAA